MGRRILGCGVVGVRNLFRLRIDSPESFQNQLFTFLDASEDAESRLAVLAEWQDRSIKSVVEPILIELTHRHAESAEWISPGTLLEDLLGSIELALDRVPSDLHHAFNVAIALSAGRNLYLLYSDGHTPWFSTGGPPMLLQSTLRVRVKDLLETSGDLPRRPPGRLHLVRVFFEDEDRVVLWLPNRDELPTDVSSVGSAREDEPAVARLVIVKEIAPGLEAVAPVDSRWPELFDEAPRRDRVLMSYAAVVLVVIVFATALFGMWRWNHIGTESPTGGVEGLATDLSTGELESRAEAPARVGSDALPSDDAATTIDLATATASAAGANGAPAAAVASTITPAETLASPPPGEAADAAEPEPLHVVWSRRYSDWVTSSPRVIQGRVVYGCRDGNLYAVDPEGAPLWQYISGSGIGASPEVDGTRLFCGNYTGRAFALRVLDGLELWARDLGARIVASPAASKKHVYFATYAGEVVALDKKTGKVAWKQRVGGQPRSRPLVVRDDLLVISDNGQVFCLQQSDGAVRWQRDTGAGVISDPLRVRDLAIFGSKDGQINAMSVDDGRFVWRSRVDGAVNSSPATNESQDTIYIGASDRNVYALRTEDGKRVWRFSTRSPVLSQPYVEDDKVYVTSYDHKSYALDIRSGALIAEVALKAPIYSSPLVHEGRVYFGSNDGTFYCVSAAR